MADHFYAYISRMRCVKRWALMRNTEEENIQEHKYYNPEIRDAYRKVEAVAGDRLLSMLPDVLRTDYAPFIKDEDETVHRLVKAADKLSAYIKCVEELKAGNLEFKKAAEQTRSALDGMRLPELDYFMEHCMESFSMTLDELESC